MKLYKKLLQMEKSASEKINGYIRRTDLLYSHYFSSLCNGSVHLKLENTQLTKAFKIRGVSNKLLHLKQAGKQNGVITASSGNHGLALALVADRLGLESKIVVPKSTPQKKIDKIKEFNSELILYGDIFDEAEQRAKDLAKKEGMTYVSSYNDKYVIAGQGTVGLEIMEDLPEVESIVVPIGGGSLISGIASAVKGSKPNVEIIGVQSEASPVMCESVKAGRIIQMEIQDSIADGLSGGIEEGSITLDLVQRLVDEIVLVKENTIREAIKLLWEKDNQVVEGAGAVGTAAMMENSDKFKGKTVVIVVSGGNIDEELFQRICV